jgi:hypothetical protein
MAVLTSCGQIPASEEATEVIVDAVQFAGISETELIEMHGEPKSKFEEDFPSPNGQTYAATIYFYDENQEFLVIDGKVVRFSYYGTGQKYKDGKHALSLFGIKPGPNMKLVADTGAAIRYRNVNESIEEFWLVESLFEEDNTIGTVKVTYDLQYF